MRASLILFFGLVAKPAMATCVAPDVEAIAQAAVEAVVDDEYEGMRRNLDAALAALECLDQRVSMEALATLWQARAAMSFFGGDIDAVVPDLRQSVAVHPGFFESRLGSDLRKLWEVEAAQSSALVSVRMASLNRGQVLWVDGQEKSGRTTELRAGVHLVQVVEDKRVVFTRLLELRPGEAATLEMSEGHQALSESVRRRLELGAAGGAVAAWTVAVVLDRRSYRVDTVGAHDRLWQSARRSAAVAVGLGGAAVFSYGLRHSGSF